MIFHNEYYDCKHFMYAWRIYFVNVNGLLNKNEKSWDDRYWFIECTERPQREIYEKSRYDIPIDYYDCKWFISVFEHISEPNY